MGIPLVYDVHHHRCLSDGSRVETITEMAIGTWDREPLFHLSSPKDGWKSGKLRNHDDYIDVSDFPSFWMNLDITVEVEAKAKELAVLKLKKDLTNLYP
jgi:UV DNA damage endonuclease